jgi:predicted aminopeptidase
LTNQKQELPMVAMLLSDQDEMSNLYRGPSIDASYQVSVNLAMRFQRKRFFRNQQIRNKNCLWWPCLLTDRDEMSNLYRGPSIDAFYQVSVHLAKQFQRKRFVKIGQSETRFACGSHVC